jgi:hypothetical protein
MRVALSGLVALTMFAGCGNRRHNREFSAIGPVTSISVSGHDRSQETAAITDKWAVSEVIDFVDEHRTGWGKPWFGIPVPVESVQFYDGTKFKGSFGVGDNFFETQRDGDFFSQSASPNEVLRFLELVRLRSDLVMPLNDRQHILDGNVRIIGTVQELPSQLKSAFVALTREPKFEMADPGHDFQIGDFVVKDLPMRRLIFAGISPERIFMHYETGGGRGHIYYFVLFSGGPPQTKLMWGATLPRAAANFAELRAIVSTASGSPINELAF